MISLSLSLCLRERSTSFVFFFFSSLKLKGADSLLAFFQHAYYLDYKVSFIALTFLLYHEIFT